MNHLRGMSAIRFHLFIAVLSVVVGCGRGPRPAVQPVEEIRAKASSPSASISEPTTTDADWPGWRGAAGDGVAVKQDFPTAWSETQNVKWKVDVPGRGHGSPSVCGETVYLATALENEQRQLVVAYARADGKKKWETELHQGGFPTAVHRKGTHANSTIACDGQRVFAAFLNADGVHVTAINLDGKIAWTKRAGPFSSKFGYAPSPIIHQGLVIIAADHWGGGFLAGLNRETGEIVWRTARPAVATYSSPLVAKVGGRDQLLISGCHKVASFDPATGKELWSTRGVSEATCGTMVTDGKHVFASGGYPERQTICVLGDGSGKVVWNNSSRSYEPSMLVSGDLLFSVTDDGVALCWEAATGKSAWKKRLGGNFSASPVVCDGKILVTNLSAETTIFAADSKAFEEIAKNKLGDDCYASPAICGGQVFLRVGHQAGGGRQERLYCLAK